MNRAMNRKRLLRRLLSMLLLLACVTMHGPAAAAEEGKVLKVGVPVDRCPIFYLDESTHEIVGIGADLMIAAAENAGYTVSFTKIGEATLKEALDNPEYDLVMPSAARLPALPGRQPSFRIT